LHLFIYFDLLQKHIIVSLYLLLNDVGTNKKLKVVDCIGFRIYLPYN